MDGQRSYICTKLNGQRFENLPTVFYNFLMFSIHICSYKALFLNDWSNPMATMCFSSCLDCNNPLIITHFCSNKSISNIAFRTFINALDLSHCAAWEIFPSILKHIYSFPGRCSVEDHGVVAVVIVSPKEEERNFFRGVSNNCESSLLLTSVST